MEGKNIITTLVGIGIFLFIALAWILFVNGEMNEPSLYEESLSFQETYCVTNMYNCDDFSTQLKAQEMFQKCYLYSGDIHHLDSDGDLIACELNP